MLFRKTYCGRVKLFATKFSQLCYIILPTPSLSLSATKYGVLFGKTYCGRVKLFASKFSQLCYIILPTSSLSLLATKYDVLFSNTYFWRIKLFAGAQWLSGRVLDSRPRGCRREPYRRHCVVVLEQDTFILA